MAAIRAGTEMLAEAAVRGWALLSVAGAADGRAASG